MRVLVIAAHPDDETIGCGGVILRHKVYKDNVSLLIMTRIYAPEWNISELDKRKKEALGAAKILGINRVYFGGFPTAKLNTIPTITLTNKISEIVNKIKPQVLYLPPEKDLNKDHEIVFHAALVAIKSKYFIKKILSYEIPTVFGYRNQDVNFYVDITKHFAKKIKAMKKYKLELRKYPHPRSEQGLAILGQFRGLAIGVKYAEAFNLIKQIEIDNEKKD